MLTTKEQKRAAEEISNSSNVIGKGTVLEGNIETYGNIRIEGRVNGNIKSKSKIALGTGSQVKGRVDIGELLVLKSTAVVHGDIITGKLVVEPGAIFNGTCKMGTVKDIKLSDSGNGLKPQQQEARMN